MQCAWQAAHAPTGSVLVLEDDVSVLHPMFRIRLHRMLSQLKELNLRSHAVQVVHQFSDASNFHVDVAIRCGREPWRTPCTNRAQCEASPALSVPFLRGRDNVSLSQHMHVEPSDATLEWRVRGISYGGLLSVRPLHAAPPLHWEFEQGGMLVSAEGARALLGLYPRDEPRVQSQELHGELWTAAHRGVLSLLASRPALGMMNMSFGQASWGKQGPERAVLRAVDNRAWRCCCNAWLPRRRGATKSRASNGAVRLEGSALKLQLADSAFDCQSVGASRQPACK
jgi:hypothetical protein